MLINYHLSFFGCMIYIFFMYTYIFWLWDYNLCTVIWKSIVPPSSFWGNSASTIQPKKFKEVKVFVGGGGGLVPWYYFQIYLTPTLVFSSLDQYNISVLQFISRNLLFRLIKLDIVEDYWRGEKPGTLSTFL